MKKLERGGGLLGRIACGAVLLGVVAAGVLAGAGPGAGTPAGEAPTGVVRTTVAEAFLLPRNPSTGSVEWFGALLIWFLLLLSMASIALIVSMAWRNRRPDIVPDDLVADVRTMMRSGRFEDALREVSDDASVFAGVLYAALREAGHGYRAMIRGSEQSYEEQTLARLRLIEPLNIIGNVAPMIGLFGTVYGMILAFRAIVGSGGTPDPVELAAGIGTALTTTFWGLVVAIPALAGYAILRGRIDALTLEAARTAEAIIGGFRPGAEQGAAKAEPGEGSA